MHAEGGAAGLDANSLFGGGHEVEGLACGSDTFLVGQARTLFLDRDFDATRHVFGFELGQERASPNVLDFHAGALAQSVDQCLVRQQILVLDSVEID